MNITDLRALLLQAAQLADALSHAPSVVNMEAVREAIEAAMWALSEVRFRPTAEVARVVIERARRK